MNNDTKIMVKILLDQDVIEERVFTLLDILYGRADRWFKFVADSHPDAEFLRLVGERYSL